MLIWRFRSRKPGVSIYGFVLHGVKVGLKSKVEDEAKKMSTFPMSDYFFLEVILFMFNNREKIFQNFRNTILNILFCTLSNVDFFLTIGTFFFQWTAPAAVLVKISTFSTLVVLVLDLRELEAWNCLPWDTWRIWPWTKVSTHFNVFCQRQQMALQAQMCLKSFVHTNINMYVCNIYIASYDLGWFGSGWLM